MANIRKRIRKDGTVVYGIRVSNGYTTDGKQIFASKTYIPAPGMTARQMDKEAQRQAMLFEQAVEGGLALESTMKLDELMDKWIKEYAEKQLKSQTVYNYKKLIPRISAALGQLRIDKIRPSHIMAFYSNLEEEGIRLDSTYTATTALISAIPHGKKGEVAKAAGISPETLRLALRGRHIALSTAEKLSATLGVPFSKAFRENQVASKLNRNSIQHYHRFLSSVFSSAVKWQLLQDNPCNRVAPPKAEDIDVEFLDENGIAALFEALKEDAPTQYSVIVQLAIFTGCRRGEICGLRWSDIDFEHGLLSINRSLTSIPGQGNIFSPPKTKRSRRCIRIEENTLQLLRDYRQYQKAERFKVGSLWQKTFDLNGHPEENDLLFTTWDGHPINPGSISSWFPQFLRKHNLPNVHFHSLRHTNASLLIAAHVPIVTVAGRLGHAQASTTTNIYAAMIRTSDAAAADALENVFNKVKEKDIG